MNIKSLLFVLCLLAMPASAQHLQLKAGGGLSTQYGSARSVGAYRFGVGYEMELDQHWSVAPALLFYGKGWKAPDALVPVLDDGGLPVLDEEGNQTYSLMSRSVAAAYLELPLLVNYYHRLAAQRYLVFSAGPYVAYGVSGKGKTKGDARRQGSEKLFYEENTFDIDEARRFDAGIQVAAGYQFPSKITLSLEADFGLVRFAPGGGRNLSALVGLTYTFD